MVGDLLGFTCCNPLQLTSSILHSPGTLNVVFAMSSRRELISVCRSYFATFSDLFLTFGDYSSNLSNGSLLD